MNKPSCPTASCRTKTSVASCACSSTNCRIAKLKILTRRFGLDGEEEQTLEEIGHRFGITRERIRQLQNAALAKLRKMLDQLEGDP